MPSRDSDRQTLRPGRVKLGLRTGWKGLLDTACRCWNKISSSWAKLGTHPELVIFYLPKEGGPVREQISIPGSCGGKRVAEAITLDVCSG